MQGFVWHGPFPLPACALLIPVAVDNGQIQTLSADGVSTVSHNHPSNGSGYPSACNATATRTCTSDAAVGNSTGYVQITEHPTVLGGLLEPQPDWTTVSKQLEHQVQGGQSQSVAQDAPFSVHHKPSNFVSWDNVVQLSTVDEATSSLSGSSAQESSSTEAARKPRRLQNRRIKPDGISRRQLGSPSTMSSDTLSLSASSTHGSSLSSEEGHNLRVLPEKVICLDELISGKLESSFNIEEGHDRRVLPKKGICLDELISGNVESSLNMRSGTQALSGSSAHGSSRIFEKVPHPDVSVIPCAQAKYVPDPKNSNDYQSAENASKTRNCAADPLTAQHSSVHGGLIRTQPDWTLASMQLDHRVLGGQAQSLVQDAPFSIRDKASDHISWDHVVRFSMEDETNTSMSGSSTYDSSSTEGTRKHLRLQNTRINPGELSLSGSSALGSSTSVEEARNQGKLQKCAPDPQTVDADNASDIDQSEEQIAVQFVQQQAWESGEVDINKLLKSVPVDENGSLTSIGSIGHSESSCKAPCVFFTKLSGCTTGIYCSFCHLPHVVRRKGRLRPNKGKRVRYRAHWETFKSQIDDNPDEFDVEAAVLPPSIASQDRLKLKMKNRMKKHQDLVRSQSSDQQEGKQSPGETIGALATAEHRANSQGFYRQSL